MWLPESQTGTTHTSACHMKMLACRCTVETTLAIPPSSSDDLSTTTPAASAMPTPLSLLYLQRPVHVHEHEGLLLRFALGGRGCPVRLGVLCRLFCLLPVSSYPMHQRPGRSDASARDGHHYIARHTAILNPSAQALRSTHRARGSKSSPCLLTCPLELSRPYASISQATPIRH